MIFLEFLKTHIGKSIRISLKGELVLQGRLVSVDPFINLKIVDCIVESNNSLVKEMKVCSIRGSSIKWIDIEKNIEVDRRLVHCALTKFSLDK